MKKLLGLFLIFAQVCLFAQTKPLPEQRAKLDGNVKDEKNFVVGSYNGSDGKVRAEFSLEGMSELPYVGLITIHAPIEKDAEKSDKNCPAMTVKLDGKTMASLVSWKKRSGASADITRYYNAAIARGDKTLSFELSQQGNPEHQTAVAIEALILKPIVEVGYDFNAITTPIWKPGTMYNEPVFFVSEDGKPARAKLLFTPKEILSAKRLTRNGVIEYKQGKDFIIEGDEIVIPEGSAIEVYKEQMYVPFEEEEKAKSLGMTMKYYPIKSYGLFKEGMWFAEHDVQFTYTHDGKNWNYEKFGRKTDKAHLPKTIAKLENKEPLKIVLFGDSISQGANSTANDFCYPYQPIWGNQVAMLLRAHYKYDDITFINRALGGTSSMWGVKCVSDLVAPDKPDLVILAFGMNDGTTTAEKRTGYINEMMQKIREQNPDVEFILVTQMMANPTWMTPEIHNTYIESDKKLQAKGVSVADVRSAHQYLLKTKNYIDLTGNHVNHPNDFLARIYAQVVASKLTKL